MSKFRIRTVSSGEGKGSPAMGRYRVIPHLSKYYQAISRLFPNMAEPDTDIDTESQIFYPERVFNPRSLLAPDGKSLIKRLMEISESVLIEDGDLTPGALVEHMSRHPHDDIKVYDLSRALRLTINHIYWITKSEHTTPGRGEKIWPR